MNIKDETMNETTRPPRAVCIKCKAPLDHDYAVSGDCPHCGGTVQIEMADNVFFECQNCSGKNCTACNGSGWLYTDVFIKNRSS